jgi:hypothetical protein
MCEQCFTITAELTDTEFGPLCDRCLYRQEEHNEYGHGLSASTFGFLSETE